MSKISPLSLEKRIYSSFQRRFQNSRLYGLSLVSSVKPLTDAIPSDWWPGDLTAGQSLVEGTFKLADKNIPLKNFSHFLAVSKECPSSLLFGIHGFGWLRDLRMVSSNLSRKRARDLITYWIHYNHSWHKKSWLLPAWRADIMGQRLRNWLGVYDFFGSSADNNFRHLFLTSLTRQYKHLHRMYSQNSLSSWQQIQALVGLIFTACVLKVPTATLNLYLAYFEKIIYQDLLHPNQKIRCPKIYFFLLQDLIDLRIVLKSRDYQEPVFFGQILPVLASLVRFFRHSNGELADFPGRLKDLEFLTLSAQSISVALIDMVLSLSDSRARSIQTTQIGYERLAAKEGVVLLNTQPSSFPATLGDRGLGILDFEWSVGPNRWIHFSDLILHSAEGTGLFLGYPSPFINTDMSLKVKRQKQDGYHHLIAELENKKTAREFYLQREFYLASNLSDFRGCEAVRFTHDGFIGIRFIFNKTVQLISQSDRTATFKVVFSPHPLNKHSEHQTWRLVCSGIEQILTESLEDGRLMVVLMASLYAQQEKTLKWAFHLKHNE